MRLTSADLGKEETTITATGALNECEKVYVTYNVAYDAGRSGGLVTPQGMGGTAERIAAGVFAGHG